MKIISLVQAQHFPQVPPGTASSKLTVCCTRPIRAECPRLAKPQELIPQAIGRIPDVQQIFRGRGKTKEPLLSSLKTGFTIDARKAYSAYTLSNNLS